MVVGIDLSDVRRTVSEETAFVLAVAVLLIGVALSYLVWRRVSRTMAAYGVPELVEGTPFERSVRRLGTSTVGIVSTLTAVFVYAGVIVFALQLTRLLEATVFWERLARYLPRLFVAILAVIFGLIGGDKAAVAVQERLKSVKLPEAALLPELVKYSVFYIAALVALSQVGIATQALLILLGAYAFGLVFLAGIAFKDLLAAAAAGVYLLLSEPYAIGDEVRVDDRRGIVQEIDMLVTRIEADGEEYILPNHRVFRSGIVRIRE